MDGRTELRTHGRTDERTERRKLYTPRHTPYVGGIKSVICGKIEGKFCARKSKEK